MQRQGKASPTAVAAGADNVLADQARRVVEEHCAVSAHQHTSQPLHACSCSVPGAGTAPELRLAPVICEGVKSVCAAAPVTPLAWKLGPALRPPLLLVSSFEAARGGQLVRRAGSLAAGDPSNQGPARTKGVEGSKGVAVVDDGQLGEGSLPGRPARQSGT